MLWSHSFIFFWNQEFFISKKITSVCWSSCCKFFWNNWIKSFYKSKWTGLYFFFKLKKKNWKIFLIFFVIWNLIANQKKVKWSYLGQKKLTLMYSLPRYSIGDVVSVYDGNSIESPMLGQFCGPTPILPKYFSSSNEIFIWFLSSRYFQYFGQEYGSGRFLMEYRTISKNSKMI